MSDTCRFCNGELIPAEETIGGGIMTVMSMVSAFQAHFGLDNEPDDSNFIQLKENNLLCFQNSSGEYTTLGVRIEYCPLCGKKLNKEEET